MLATSGQLSVVLGIVSPSVSLGSNVVHVVVLALSGQTSQASPTPSPSKSACLPASSGRMALKTLGQLSIASGMPSPSMSPAAGTPVYALEPFFTHFGARCGVHEGSFIGWPQKKA